ncbi:MAG: VanZ family protein [Oscillospiraceae bacterium]|nr:VanZ family protein [Oscillospiraceae bacterium]
MIRTKKRLTLCISLLIANIVFIWGNSLLPGEISGAISDFVRDALRAVIDFLFGGRPDKPSGGGGLLRKLAHFTEFTCLGMCLCWLFGILKDKAYQRHLFPLLTGFSVACIDETIQMFVPLRGPAIKDVGIDTAGVILGIVLITLIHKNKNKNSKNLEENKL